VFANPVVVDRVEQLIEDLDAETERLIFEARLRKELVSDIAVNLLRRSAHFTQHSRDPTSRSESLGQRKHRTGSLIIAIRTWSFST